MTDYATKVKQLEAELSASDEENVRAPSRRRRATRRPLAAASGGASATLVDEPIVKKALNTDSGANAVRKPKLECAFCKARFSQRVAPLFREHLQTCVLKQVERSREFLDSSIVDLVRSKYASSKPRKAKRKRPAESLAAAGSSGSEAFKSEPCSSGLCETVKSKNQDGLKLSEYFTNSHSESHRELPFGERDASDENGSSEDEDDEDEMTCAFCGRCMEAWSVERRAVHTNRCAAADDRAARAELALRDALVDTAQRATLACPLCEAPTKTVVQRKSHIKRCAAQHHVPFDHLLVLVRNQERAFIARLNQLAGKPDVNFNDNENDHADQAAATSTTCEPGPSTADAQVQEQQARLNIAALVRLLDENGISHKPVEQDPVTNRYRFVPKVKVKKVKPNSSVSKQEVSDVSAGADDAQKSRFSGDDISKTLQQPQPKLEPNMHALPSVPIVPTKESVSQRASTVVVKQEVLDNSAGGNDGLTNRTAFANGVNMTTSTPFPLQRAQMQTTVTLTKPSTSQHVTKTSNGAETTKPASSPIASASAPTSSQRPLIQTVLTTNTNASANRASRAAYRALVREESNKLRMMSRLEQLLQWNTKSTSNAAQVDAEADFRPTVVTLSINSTGFPFTSVLDQLDVSVATESDSLWRLASLSGSEPPGGWITTLPCLVPFTMLDPDRIPGRWNDAKLAEMRRRKHEAALAKQAAASVSKTSPESTNETCRTCTPDCLLYGNGTGITTPSSPFVILARHFARLLDDASSADAKIVFLGGASRSTSESVPTICLHTAVLAARCKPLLERVSAAADSTWRVDTATYKIEPHAMRMFVEYIYSAHECPILNASPALLDQFYRVGELVHMDEFEALLNRRVSLHGTDMPSLTAGQSATPPAVNSSSNVTSQCAVSQAVFEFKRPLEPKQDAAQNANQIESTDSIDGQPKPTHLATAVSTSVMSNTPPVTCTTELPSAQPCHTDTQLQFKSASPRSETGQVQCRPIADTDTNLRTPVDSARCVEPAKRKSQVDLAPKASSPSYILSSDSDDETDDRQRDTIFTQKFEPLHQSPSPSKRNINSPSPKRKCIKVNASKLADKDPDSPIVIDSDSSEDEMKEKTKVIKVEPRRSARRSYEPQSTPKTNVNAGAKAITSTLRYSACERPRAHASSPVECCISQPSSYDPVPADLPSVLDVTYFELSEKSTSAPTTRHALRESLLRTSVENRMTRDRTKTETQVDLHVSGSPSPVFTKRRKKTNSSNQRLGNSNDYASSVDLHADSGRQSVSSRSVQRRSCSQPAARPQSNDHDNQLLRLSCHDEPPSLTAPQALHAQLSPVFDRPIIATAARTNACASSPPLVTSLMSAPLAYKGRTEKEKSCAKPHAVTSKHSRQLNDSDDDDLPPPFSQVVRQMLEQESTTAKQPATACISSESHQREVDAALSLADLSHPSALFTDWDADLEPEPGIPNVCRNSPAKQQHAATSAVAVTHEPYAECETDSEERDTPLSTAGTPYGRNVADVSNYSAMDTPGLHRELARYGLKRLARRKAVLVLRDIRSRLRHSAQRHICARRSVERATRTLHKAAAAHTLTPRGVAPCPARPKAAAKRRSNRVLFAPPADDRRAQPKKLVPEESIMFPSASDEEDEYEYLSFDDDSRGPPSAQTSPVKQDPTKRCDSQPNATRKRKQPEPEAERTTATRGAKSAKRRKPKSEVIREAVLECFRSDDTFYLRILCYEPIAIEEFQERIRAADIRCGEQRLINILDEQCITFSLRHQNSFLHRNRDAAKRNANAHD